MMTVNMCEGNDRHGMMPDANCPDDNQSTRSGSDNIPWFLMKSRGMTHGNLRKRPRMNRNWAARVGALRNGKG